MRTRLLFAIAALAICGSMYAAAQRAAGPAPRPNAPRDASAPPTVEQMRRTVANLKGNRIRTPDDYDALTPGQKEYVRSILSGPRSSITGPLGVMMVSPGLGDLTQKAMAYARFAGEEGFSSVPPKYNELAILIVAKHWSAEYVWNAHHNYGVRMGLAPELVESIRTGRRPTSMPQDVEAVYNFASEFISNRQVSDATLNAARTVLGGDRGIVDLVGTMGLYQISSMMVALDQTPLGGDAKPYFAR